MSTTAAASEPMSAPATTSASTGSPPIALSASTAMPAPASAPTSTPAAATPMAKSSVAAESSAVGSIDAKADTDLPDESVADESLTPLVALFQEKSIRILGTVDDPLFCATDVAAHIRDKHFERALVKFPERFFCWRPACDSIGRPQKTKFFTEAGLYKYLLQSKQKGAEPFQLFTYDLLTAERKRTVDSVKLALKLKETEVAEQTEKKVAEDVLRHTGRLELYDAMRAVNIARAELKVEEAQVAWYEKGVDNVASVQDEYSAVVEAKLPPHLEWPVEAPPRHEAAAAAEVDPLTPLAALFETRGIRITGTICEPLFCAADVAVHIGDDNSARYFQNRTPELYLKWVPLRDAQGQQRPTRALTEAGLYRYLLQSTLEKAEPFQEYTYNLLTQERKRTVSGARLALKIAETLAEELKRQNATSQKGRRRERKRCNECARIANETKQKLQTTRGKLRKLQMKKAIELDKEAIRHYCAPFPPPEFQMPVSKLLLESMRLTRQATEQTVGHAAANI